MGALSTVEAVNIDHFIRDAQGVVLRFDRVKRAKGMPPVTLNYAAIYTNGGWYLTGTSGLGRMKLNHEQMLTMLNHPDVTAVSVATAFVEVKG